MSTETSDGPTSYLERFGLAVRMERKALGYSQEAFADAVGLDRSYMGGVERGERNIALVNIMRIVEALGTKPSRFFMHLDPATSAEPI